MIKNILVPIDGSDHSRKALTLACDMAEKYDATLHLLHVAQPLHEGKTLVLGAAAVTVHASQEDLEKAGRQVVDAARAIAGQSGCGDVKTEIVGGDPAKKIVERAKSVKADLIVMGSRGLSDLSGLLMGSVSHKVNQIAPCTCVSVR